MLELEAAVQQILTGLQSLGSESVPLEEALDRIVAEDVISPLDLPAFDNSAMDGYAVRSLDLSSHSNTMLKLAGEIAAGQFPSCRVEPGSCVGVFTGSMLPEGADAVVMQEETKGPDENGDVTFSATVKPWENVRFRGEDVKGGARLGQTGQKLTAGRITLLRSVGVSELKVFRRPTVALIATGNELQEPGTTLKGGNIFETNRQLLATLVRKSGGTPEVFPILPDDLPRTEELFRRVLGAYDVIISTGGASVGKFDFVKEAMSAAGATLDFWRVAIKPGKPFAFGRWKNTLFFGLPGNPVSAWITFLLLVKPALLKLQGMTDPAFSVRPGRLAEPLINDSERKHFVRVYQDAAGQVHSAGTQASHILSSLAAANGLVAVPARSTLPAETFVSVIDLE